MQHAENWKKFRMLNATILLAAFIEALPRNVQDGGSEPVPASYAMWFTKGNGKYVANSPLYNSANSISRGRLYDRVYF